MSTKPNAINAIELTQAELDSVTGGGAAGSAGSSSTGNLAQAGQLIAQLVKDGWKWWEQYRVPEEDNGGS
jgi:hypothetical protein